MALFYNELLLFKLFPLLLIANPFVLAEGLPGSSTESNAILVTASAYTCENTCLQNDRVFCRAGLSKQSNNLDPIMSGKCCDSLTECENSFLDTDEIICSTDASYKSSQMSLFSCPFQPECGDKYLFEASPKAATIPLGGSSNICVYEVGSLRKAGDVSDHFVELKFLGINPGLSITVGIG